MCDWSGEVYVHEPGQSHSFRGLVECRGDSQGDLVGRRRVQREILAERSTEIDWYSTRDYTPVETSVVDSAPPKLFDLTLSFVAARLQLVDSLEGFPEQVGRRLFDEALRLGRFRRPADCPEAFRLFVDAYGSRFVESCELPGVTVDAAVVDAVDACSGALTSVSWKDLEFASPDLRRSLVRSLSFTKGLLRLSLINCGLRDDDLRHLTAPSRMRAERSLDKLQELDLSGNYDLSGCCVRYVVAFPRLRLLKMTGTTVSSNRGVERLEEMGFRAASTDHVARLLELERGGAFAAGARRPDDAPWADAIFKTWLKSSAILEESKKTEDKNNDFAFSSFYNAKRERAKEARRRNSLTVPLVFVKRGDVDAKENAPPRTTGKTLALTGSGNRTNRKRSLVEAESALEAIWGEEEEESRKEERESRDEDDDELARFYEPDATSRNSKKRKLSLFDVLSS